MVTMSGTQVAAILLFPAPFIAFGVLAGYRLVQGLADSSLGPWDVAGYISAIVAFGGTGVWLFRLFIGGDWDEKAEQNIRWSAGPIHSTTQVGVRRSWHLALVWNMLSAPLFVLGVREIGRTLFGGLFLLLIPGAGIGFVFRAILITLRWRRFGRSTFEMSPLPARPGGLCTGTIHTRLMSARRTSFHVVLKLTCMEQIWEGRTRVQRNILWREVSVIPPAQISFGSIGASIPVLFALPADARQTTVIGQLATGVRWLLEAEAEMTGVNLKDVFEVPVLASGSDKTGL